jgi:hypothetical protein
MANLPSIENRRRRRRNLGEPGGTPGGAGSFVVGFVMTAVGLYLILSRVQVTTGFWLWWGPGAFGLTLVPLIAGVGLLFFNGRSALGWFLTVGGLAIILAGIISNLQIYLWRTNLFEFLVMLVLLIGGVGLMARAVLTDRG